VNSYLWWCIPHTSHAANLVGGDKHNTALTQSPNSISSNLTNNDNANIKSTNNDDANIKSSVTFQKNYPIIKDVAIRRHHLKWYSSHQHDETFTNGLIIVLQSNKMYLACVVRKRPTLVSFNPHPLILSKSTNYVDIGWPIQFRQDSPTQTEEENFERLQCTGAV